MFEYSLVVLILNVIWIRIVSQSFVSLPLSRLGNFIAALKWIVCPIAGLMLWVEGYPFEAIVALSWPMLLITILFTIHRFWPPSALANTQEMFRVATKNKSVR